MNTQLEDDADDFDRRLFVLIGRAEYMADRSTPKAREKWWQVRTDLHNARSIVRTFMTARDRARTEA